MIAGRTQMNKAHCQPKSIPSAIGTLTAEPAVAKIDIDVVYKLGIKATFAGKFSLITPVNKTFKTAIPSPIDNVPVNKINDKEIVRKLIAIIKLRQPSVKVVTFCHLL